MSDITIPAAALEKGARAAYEKWRKKIIVEEKDSMPADMLSECAPTWAKLHASNKADWTDQARAAFLAMLGAWPGMERRIVYSRIDEWPNKHCVILPLAA